MPFLDASALDRDTEGLAFLKAVLAQPAANDRFGIVRSTGAAGLPFKNSRARTTDIASSMIIGVPVPSCLARSCPAEGSSGAAAARDASHQGRSLDLCASLGALGT
jgi:hypothetical protein